VSGAERSHPEQCGFYTHWRLGFQSIVLSYDWRPGFQVSDNERPEYTELITGFQIGIRRGARSGFMKLKLQQFTEIKGPIRKI
jgi:hypothetical protein